MNGKISKGSQSSTHPPAYLDEVISAAEVQLGENGGSTTLRTCSRCRWDERKRITELDCDFVECPVIDTQGRKPPSILATKKSLKQQGTLENETILPVGSARYGTVKQQRMVRTIVPNAYSVHFRLTKASSVFLTYEEVTS